MTIDPHRPVHVVFAAPWQSVDRGRRRADTEMTWWTFPDPVADGDTVITVVDAREPAIVGVSMLRMASEDDWDLVDDEPRLHDAMATAAVARRIERPFPIDPRTLHHTEGIEVLAAITAEAALPTPWHALPNPCSADTQPDVSHEARWWGCVCCDRYRDSDFRPRFQRHVGRGWPFDSDEHVAVCPSCHDILHQPLGPTVDEMMFRHRPACPECAQRRTFRLLMGMPPGPPPYGTVIGGCVVTNLMAQLRCGACSHEW